jgi:hypothetical protein
MLYTLPPLLGAAGIAAAEAILSNLGTFSP